MDVTEKQCNILRWEKFLPNGIGIGIEVNSNSGIDPNPESDRQLDNFHLHENHKIIPAFYRKR